MVEGLGPQLWAWFGLAVLSVWLRMGRGKASSGLILSWVAALWVLNWFPAYVHATPEIERAPDDVVSGFPICLAAMAAGCLGIALAELYGRSGRRTPERGRPLESEALILRMGFVAYIGTMLGLVSFPSVTAVFSTAANLLVLAVAWRLRREVSKGLSPGALGWLGAGLSFPLATTAIAGFIGYGAFSSLLVLSHQVTAARKRLWMLPVGALAVFLSLSVFVTYMRDRSAIRDQVWGGQSLVSRATQLVDTFSRFEFLSLDDPTHRDPIINRLDQVSFVGAARKNLEFGIVAYADGETFIDALLALIPRALWPDKPIGAGSGGLVSRFTGQEFAVGTSVGVTQVLEGYINFGIGGVVFLFVALGFALARADAVAGECLESGDLSRFLGTTLPAIALLNVGGSLVETSVSVVAGFAVIWLLRRFGLLASRPRTQRTEPNLVLNRIGRA